MRLIDVGPQVFVGLHARLVLLISRQALDLLNAEELQALAAHEMGHLYFQDEYEEARRRSDHRWLQELELRCDGIAAITLQGLNLPADHRVSAVTRTTRHNRRVGATGTASYYVPVSDRVRFIRAVAALAGATPPPAR